MVTGGCVCGLYLNRCEKLLVGGRPLSSIDLLSNNNTTTSVRQDRVCGERRGR